MENYRYIFKHQKMTSIILRIIVNSFRPFKGLLQSEGKSIYIDIHRNALDRSCIDHFHKLLGKQNKYQETIAPHMFPYWSYPPLLDLGLKLKFPLHKVMNQACKMEVFEKIPKNTKLKLHVEIISTTELESKIKIKQKISTYIHKTNKLAVEAYLDAVIIKQNKILNKSQPSKKMDISSFDEQRPLKFTAKDCRDYAFSTGDLNPIHLSKFFAKIFGLSNIIVHGFLQYSKIFEILEDQFIIKSFDIKFLSPLQINEYAILIWTVIDDKVKFRLINQEQDKVFLTGISYIKKPA